MTSKLPAAGVGEFPALVVLIELRGHYWVYARPNACS